MKSYFSGEISLRDISKGFSSLSNTLKKLESDAKIRLSPPIRINAFWGKLQKMNNDRDFPL